MPVIAPTLESSLRGELLNVFHVNQNIEPARRQS